jgi:maltose alpha-D-glucosyltransferase/alpha-amylase
MNSLLLSMPGSPIIYYGDEIGMGDNIFLGDRNGVRTPMQWTPDRNAGFSRADPQRLFLPPIMDPVYGFEAVNVEAQAREPSSLLNWMRRMLAVRKQSHAFGRGRLTFLKPGNGKVLAYLREVGEEAILCVANVGRSAQPVELDLAKYRGRVPVEMLGRVPFPPIGELPYLLTLPAHGFYWFRLAADVEAPAWHEAFVEREEIPMLVLFDGWMSFFRDRVVPWRIGMAQKVRDQFEQDTMPRYIEGRRWFAQKGETVKRAKLVDHGLWERDDLSWLLGQYDVEAGAETVRYFIPLALAWEETDDARVRNLKAATVAKVRQQANVGVMADAFPDVAFCRAMVETIGQGHELATLHGKLRFVPTRAFRDIAGPDVSKLELGRPKTQGSNSVVSLSERLFLKGYRRVRPGLNPELEMGRFLTEVARFPNCVPVAGALEYIDADGTPSTLALLQAYLPNEGDGWSYTIDYLERFIEEHATAKHPVAPDVHGGFLPLMQTLGTRTAELHRALASSTRDPAFDPEPFIAADLVEWKRSLLADVSTTLEALEQRRNDLPPTVRAETYSLVQGRDRLIAHIENCSAPQGTTLKTRYHGDYHLGQVLLSNHDFVIIDFEGEPARPLSERRTKHSPLRDVAGMLRSFDYARWTALRHAADGGKDLTVLEPLATQWEREVRRTFIAAYEEATRESGLYADFLETRDLLELAELEKALYELRYELGNRPDWVTIPLRGILSLVAGAGNR